MKIKNNRALRMFALAGAIAIALNATSSIAQTTPEMPEMQNGTMSESMNPEQMRQQHEQMLNQMQQQMAEMTPEQLQQHRGQMMEHMEYMNQMMGQMDNMMMRDNTMMENGSQMQDIEPMNEGMMAE